MQKEKYICIHGHFYQPLRINPWIEEIEEKIDMEATAEPYHDWNEKIFKECYEANLYSRILDSEGKIRYVLNNFRFISFNFGATLLRWLEEKEPKSYEKILWADRESQKDRSGHGNALAQSYHHSILPLLEKKEKQTEIFWGIQDFRYRFGRDPEGIWLPETAVDHETLEMVADQGIRFVILAPHQAKRVKEINWVSSSEESMNGSINPRQAYTYSISGNQSLAVFFYDSSLAHEVAFGNLLQDGKTFSKKLQNAFQKKERKAQLVHLATDGESYGHHSEFGEMALSYAVYDLFQQSEFQLTNYGEFLVKHPPIHEVEIRERSSWSCPHDLGRWQSHCGCNFKKEWNQNWRDPLRIALLNLKSNLDRFFEQEAPRFFSDIWNARNHYIRVIFAQNKEQYFKNLEHFFLEQGTKDLKKDLQDPSYLANQRENPNYDTNTILEIQAGLKLLEMQRESLSMFVSCAWFFDDISGIESMQALKHAGRALELMKEYEVSYLKSKNGFSSLSKSLSKSLPESQKIDLQKVESTFLNFLEQAKSNIPEKGNAKQMYQKQFPQWKMDLKKIASLCILELQFLNEDLLAEKSSNWIRLYGCEFKWKELEYSKTFSERIQEKIPKKILSGSLQIRSKKTLEGLDCCFRVFLKKDPTNSKFNLYFWILDQRTLVTNFKTKKKESIMTNGARISSEFLESQTNVYSLDDFNIRQDRIVQALFWKVLDPSLKENLRQNLRNHSMLQDLRSCEKTWNISRHLPLTMLQLGLFLEELARTPDPLDDQALGNVLEILRELSKPNTATLNSFLDSERHSEKETDLETELKKYMGFLLEKKLSICLSTRSLHLVLQILECCENKFIPLSFFQLQKQYSDLSFQIAKEPENLSILFEKLGEKLGFSSKIGWYSVESSEWKS